MPKQIPVTIVSGFLGAGKTTLINKVLKEEHKEHIAVIINEFGSVGVDHQFVLDVKEDIYQMDNGCLCCTLRNDIPSTLESILSAKEKMGVKVDRILFETTGLADPAPIAHTFINVPFLNENFIVDAVLTVVDAKNFLKETKEQEEPAKQVGFADKIFISKHQLVDSQTYHDVIESVRSINAFAPIQDLSEKEVTLKDMFNLELFYASEEKVLEMEERAKEDECPHCHEHHEHGEHCCHHEHGECCHHDEDCDCHDHEHCHHDEHDCDCDCDHHDEHGHCKHHGEHKHHHRHPHHSGITSFVFEAEKPLNLSKINQWLNELVYYYGEQLYRYKGILNVEGIEHQIIFQGVQMSFDISKGRDWGPTERKSTLVFIGKNLPEKQLRKGFDECTK
ncbi:GTP-binding protein [Carnobacteriaceae bacterium zg-84]|uniref:CobW family GTP-binding protein n=1 Tax=Granulicatella sp. zg-84 TaxID=2678503 RepID=UPI0013C166C1|nr:GTP-binding protein [Granulicatella sp. zg-84]NEW66311.1 GTP-binding protein [Granulicatella sp. zg-84]QMI85377.1 GTP-binding protein [Carnobacteriaceae bacterium zg-84]